MSEDESPELYAFCTICQQNVPLEVTEDDIEKAKTGLISVLSIHGDPQHAILVYLDMNLKARGIEYPSLLQAKESRSSDGAKAIIVEDDTYDLGSIISSFGEKQDLAIKSFARITAQLIAGNTVYLIHNNSSIGKVVKDQLSSLFTDHKISLTVISYDEMDNVSGMRPTIFDLQHGSFVSEGIVLDIGHFEQLIKDAVGSSNGFNVLKNDYGKLKYSYRRLWELLTAGARRYTRKKLAYLVSIDLSMIPLLLRMAENDGVDVASRLTLSKEEKRKKKKKK
ncbi:MAG: hypothetical protein ACTSU3_05690 [Candidatus Thorarchaeota archaeon]